MKPFITLSTSNRRKVTKAIIIMRYTQNGVSMKKKVNTSTRQKQLVEKILIENYAKCYKLTYSYVRNESNVQDIVQDIVQEKEWFEIIRKINCSDQAKQVITTKITGCGTKKILQSCCKTPMTYFRAHHLEPEK